MKSLKRLIFTVLVIVNTLVISCSKKEVRISRVCREAITEYLFYFDKSNYYDAKHKAAINSTEKVDFLIESGKMDSQSKPSARVIDSECPKTEITEDRKGLRDLVGQ